MFEVMNEFALAKLFCSCTIFMKERARKWCSHKTTDDGKDAFLVVREGFCALPARLFRCVTRVYSLPDKQPFLPARQTSPEHGSMAVLYAPPSNYGQNSVLEFHHECIRDMAFQSEFFENDPRIPGTTLTCCNNSRS